MVTAELKKRSTDFDETAYSWADASKEASADQTTVGRMLATVVEDGVNAVERATGVDLDGDGDVGRRGSASEALNC